MRARSSKATTGRARALRKDPTGRRVRLARVGRFLVPVDEPRIVSYFRRHLWTAHGVRDRLARLLPGPPVRRLWAADSMEVLLGPLGAPTESHAGLRGPTGALVTLLGLPASPLVRDSGLEGREPVRWILREASVQGSVEEWQLFLFGPGDAGPAAVVRIRRDGDPDGVMDNEWQALRRLRRELPPELAASLPEPLAHVRSGDFVALSVGPRPGRTAYVDLHSDLAPGRHATRHLEAAAEWLAAFHRTRRHHGTCTLHPSAWSEEGASYQGLEVPLVDAHGDFWAGNLLLSRDDGPSVVDWGRFQEGVLPSADLFEFALSYAFNYPISRYRRLPAEAAFRAAFLEDTKLARRIRGYFRTYCRRTDLDPRLLRPLLEHDLARRYGDAAAASGHTLTPASTRDRQEEATWSRLSDMLAGADRCVLSV